MSILILHVFANLYSLLIVKNIEEALNASNWQEHQHTFMEYSMLLALASNNRLLQNHSQMQAKLCKGEKIEYYSCHTLVLQ